MSRSHRKWKDALLTLSLFAVAALVSTVSLAETTLERIKREGFVRVGFANEAPFGFATADGKLTGEAPELARIVLSSFGNVQLDGVLTEFGSLIPGLVAGRFDIIAAGMFIRPARCEQVLFSEPTYGMGQAFLVRAGNPKDLHSYEDVANHADAVLAVVAGGVEVDYAKSAGIPDDRMEIYPENAAATSAVRSGRADALALTSLVIQDIVDRANDPELERANPFTDPVVDGASVRGFGAFGFRKEDTELRDVFNSALKKLIGTPEHLALVRQFGYSEQELPGEVTTEQLCAGK